MLIDWFTIIAQIINFLILLFLLHRFLYKPILKNIDKRQDQMQARWDQAETEKEKAKAETEKHRRAQQELDEQREHLLTQARSEAEEIRHTELQQTREEIAQKRQEWKTALENEQQSLIENLQEQFGQQVIEIVRQVLRDIAQADLEQQAIQAFQHKLDELDENTRQAIAQSFSHQDHPITVQTSHSLPEPFQNSLRQSLQDHHLLNGQAIHFDLSPDLLFGIRLKNEAYDLSWNAEDYLQNLEQTLRQGLPETADQPQHPNE